MGVLFVAAGTAAALLVAPAGATAAPIEECGNFDGHWTYDTLQGAGTYNVTARVVSCREARTVALKAEPGRRFGGWSCRYMDQGYEFADVRCTKPGGRVIRWQAGA